MKALIYKSTGSWYAAKNEAGETFNARIKGVFKIDGINSTNPIAVGDYVELEEEGNSETAIITKIYDRHNYVARVSPANKNQHHIIASNIDQSILICTLKQPKTSHGFIDRFLISCEAYHVPAILVFNKVDVYREKEMQLMQKWEKMYGSLGYKVLCTSVPQKIGIEDVQRLLQNKTTLLSGHSGVGKTSLINAIFPNINLKTKEVSGWSGKGMHTTTFAEMFDLPNEGKIIDTPGLREFGIIDITKQELSHYYPEMRALLTECQFNNCLHINEPNCAIKKAVEEGLIAVERYASYLNIMETINDRNW